MIKLLKKHKIFLYFLIFFVFVCLMVMCICIGSVSIPIEEIFEDKWSQIVFEVRIPRVICVAFIGAALSVCGVAMQGLLRNPLADGTTLGVSSGASLGAVLAIILSNNFLLLVGNTSKALIIILSILSAFLSFLIIVVLTYKLDKQLSTNTIILIGVIFSMFASSMISLLIALFPENTKSITFWTMGSVVGVNYPDCVLLGISFVICTIVLCCKSTELDIFAFGENNANHLGVNVLRTKVVIMLVVSVLIGVCVSVSGTIGFVGLIVPHISRMIVGSKHKKLLIFSTLFGASFLMLADLLARTVISPKELPIGVITSIVGAIVFVIIFYRTIKRHK